MSDLKPMQEIADRLMVKGSAWRREEQESGDCQTYLSPEAREAARIAAHVDHHRLLLPARYRDAVLDEPLPPGSLFLTGPAGTGKTYAAAATALATVADGVGTFSWLNVSRWLGALRSAINGGPQPPTPVQIVARASLVVLDDLGAERVTEYARDCLYDLINVVWESQVRMIVTSNVQISDIKKSHGERIASRLAGECTPLRFAGADRRLPCHSTQNGGGAHA